MSSEAVSGEAVSGEAISGEAISSEAEVLVVSSRSLSVRLAAAGKMNGCVGQHLKQYRKLARSVPRGQRRWASSSESLSSYTQ